MDMTENFQTLLFCSILIHTEERPQLFLMIIAALNKFPRNILPVVFVDRQ